MSNTVKEPGRRAMSPAGRGAVGGGTWSRGRGEDVRITDCHDGNDGDDDVSLLLTFSV